MAMKGVNTTVTLILVTLLTSFGISLAASIDHQFDNLNRLRMEKYDYGKTRIYEYDEVGNRTTNYTMQFMATTQSGSANPSGALTIQEGASRTVYFTPIPHYHVHDVIVDGTSKGAISSYSFSNVPAPQNVEARFAIDRFYLGVTVYWGSYGKVTSSIPGINCGGGMDYDCGETYDYGTSLTLTPVPYNDAYYFTGWAGACSGLGTCTLFMDSTKYAYAYFSIKTFGISTSTVYTPYYIPDSYAQWGVGGTITPSSPTVTYDGYQTLTITPNSGNKITNVKIDGENMGAISSYTFLNVKAPHSIVAQFYYKYNYSVPINIYLNNTNGGNVTSPSGIYCGMGGTVCSNTFDYYTYVKLTATNNVGYGISGMSGASCGYYNYQGVTADENGLPTYKYVCITSAYATQNISYTFSPLTVWPINANPVGAGTISPPGRTYVGVGHGKTYTITPSYGATISDVTVDNVSVGPVASYTFNNISTYHNITATFSCSNLPVRIMRYSCSWGSCRYYYYYYATLQAAYNAAVSGDVIQTVEGLVDNLNANRDISVTVSGGYDCYYTSNYGKTTVMKGTMTTTAGSVSLSNFSLL